MMCCGEKRGAGFWIKRAIFIPLAIAAGVTLFGFVVMHLWNWLMPALFGLGMITFWQALGILILSKILFGGFKGCPGHKKFHGHMHDMHGRFMHMSPEAREKMKAEWKDRCGCSSEEKKD